VDNLVFYIGLGLGLGLACGLRPFLPLLLAGGLASDSLLGVSFHTGNYAFLESGWWLVALALALVVSYALQRLLSAHSMDAPLPSLVLLSLSIGAGALLFGGTLCDHNHAAWPGLAGGAGAALLAAGATQPLMRRARARLSARAEREALTLYLDLASLVVAGLVALLHPLGYVALAFFLWVAWSGRAPGASRHAGLRILGRD
jgi:hypothetical protein